MSNKEIIQGNNLKLQDCVDLANNLPDAQNIEPIYGTVSYTYSDIIDFTPSNIQPVGRFVYGINNYQIYAYYDGKLIGSINRGSTATSNYNIVLKVTDDYIIIAYTTENSADSRNYISFKITKTEISEIGSITMPSYHAYSNCISFDNTIFMGSSDGLICRYDESTNTLKSYSEVGFTVHGSTLTICYANKRGSGNTLAKYVYDPESDEYTVTTKAIQNIMGVNYYENKVFQNGNIYELNADLSIGKLLKENAYSFSAGNYGPYIVCLNDKYYFNTNDDKLYSFDEDTNTFTEEPTLADTTVLVSDHSKNIYFRYSNQTKRFIYFNFGETIIGYNYNGVYIPIQQGLVFNSKYILAGETFYDNSLNPIVGTMSNNGELTYTPSTEEQTIPEGYTSGGTIAPAPLTDTEYNECLTLSQQILGEISL